MSMNRNLLVFLCGCVLTSAVSSAKGNDYLYDYRSATGLAKLTDGEWTMLRNGKYWNTLYNPTLSDYSFEFRNKYGGESHENYGTYRWIAPEDEVITQILFYWNRQSNRPEFYVAAFDFSDVDAGASGDFADFPSVPVLWSRNEPRPGGSGNETFTFEISEGITSIGLGFYDTKSQLDERVTFNTIRIYTSDISGRVTKAPVFSPYRAPLTGPVTITCPTEGADIYYTTDGTTPTTASTLYTGPVTLGPGQTHLQAIAVGPEDTSRVRSWNYQFAATAAAPIFSPGIRYISGPTMVTITSEMENARIYYTTDGSTPSASSMLYTGPVQVENGSFLQAIAFADFHNPSSVTGMTYMEPSSYNRPETIPWGSAVIDGDLEEWASSTWTPLDQVPLGESGASDVPDAYYAAKWQANKIYVAVKVRDTAQHFTDTYTQWNKRDAIEVFVHTDSDGPLDYSATNAIAQQYVFGMKKDKATTWGTVGANGAKDLSVWPSVAISAGRVDGEWIYYELAITPFSYLGLVEKDDLSTSRMANLTTGTVIGLDIEVISTDIEGNYLGKKSENTMMFRYMDWESIGLHRLVGSAPLSLPGDANEDGKVDVGDLGILAANYGLASGATWAMGDFTGDGKVDVGDLGVLAANYGTGTSGVDFDADYAKVFGEANDGEGSSSLCSSLGFSLIAGLALVGLMLVKEGVLSV